MIETSNLQKCIQKDWSLRKIIHQKVDIHDLRQTKYEILINDTYMFLVSCYSLIFRFQFNRERQEKVMGRGGGLREGGEN